MGGVHTVSTAGIPASERIYFWNSGARTLGKVQATPLGDVFEARASTRRLGHLLVFGLWAAPHHVRLVRDHAAPPEEGGFLRLRYQRSGECTVEQDGRQRSMSAGQWLVIDGSRPHTVSNMCEASSLSLQLPRSVLSARDLRLAKSLHGPFAMNGHVSKLLFECLRLSIEDLDEMSESASQELGLSMLEMFRIATNEVAAQQDRSSNREVMEQRVRDHIRRHLYEPDLSVESVAKSMGCSSRYIHKIFESQESVSRMIWSQRLDRCKEELMAPRNRDLTLTELAYEFGFSSSSHFSRSFRTRFGMTPSEFRSKIDEGAVGDLEVH